VIWAFTIVVGTLGIVLLWGLLAPRSSWRSLTGWSVSDPHGNEPGAGSYGVRRLVAGVGTLGLAAVLVVAASSFLSALPVPPPPPSSVRVMWGAPDPQVVDRIVVPLAAPPAGLPEMPILGYQAFGGGGAASYLSRLRHYSYLGNDAVPGYIGVAPELGLSAIDTASLVVNVRGPILCIPRQAVVIETQTTVQIGIYYGLPDPANSSAADNVTNCPLGATLTASLLIPIALAAPVGDRMVQALDGTALQGVALDTSN
jgi:hypothetical protein